MFLLKYYLVIFSILIQTKITQGQLIDRAKLNQLTETYITASYGMFHELLSLPNDANFQDHVKQNLNWMDSAFKKRNFETSILKSDGPPLLLAEKATSGSRKTVLIYLQVDGQPVDPTKWRQESPYKPVLKKQTESGEWQEISWSYLQNDKVDPEWRIFARSASDAKGPISMFLTAIDIMKTEKIEPTFNMKVIMDFEEEQGSPNLPAAVKKHIEALKADMLIIFDGPRHTSNRPTLTFGARGIATIKLKVFGPKKPQHSGHYGNYIPNPAYRLVQLLASMKDEDGRVTIPGFYDGIELDQKTRKILARIPDDENDIKRKIGFSEADKVAGTLQEAIQYPSLNIRGMTAGWVGKEVRTIIPSEALAEIDVRLVPETDAEQLIGLIRAHIEQRGYYLIKAQPTDDERTRYPRIASFNYEISYRAFRTPFDSEVGVWLNKAIVRAFAEEPVKKRMSGGSIPISPFITTLNIPAVTVPTVNADNNQHSPNENLRLGNYRDGIMTFLSVLTQEF